MEEAVKLKSDAPIPGAAPAITPAPTNSAAPAGSPAGSPGAALKPVNATCPVSGEPVNPKYTVVFEGRVVGFCCPNCPGKFWANPQEYKAKLPQ